MAACRSGKATARQLGVQLRRVREAVHAEWPEPQAEAGRSTQPWRIMVRLLLDFPGSTRVARW